MGDIVADVGTEACESATAMGLAVVAFADFEHAAVCQSSGAKNERRMAGRTVLNLTGALSLVVAAEKEGSEPVIAL